MIRFSVHFFFLYTLWATVVPYMPYLLRARGFSEEQIGLLTAGWDLAAIAGGLLLGQLADRLGARRLLLGAAVAVGVGVFVPLCATGRFAAALPLMIVAGLSFRTTIPLSDALAIGELPQPTHQYGLSRAWGTVGFIVLLAVVRLGRLVDETDAQSMLRAIVLTGAACLATVCFLPNRRQGSARAPLTADGRGFGRAFWIWMIAAAASAMAMASQYTFFPLYLKDVLHMQQGAWVWALGAVAELPILIFGGPIIRRAGLVPMLLVGLLAVTVRLGSYAVMPYFGVVIAAQALHALTFGVFHVATVEFIHRHTPQARWSLAMAIYACLGMGLPRVLGNALGGYLVAAYGYTVLFGLYALLPLTAVGLLLACRATLDARPADGSPASTR